MNRSMTQGDSHFREAGDCLLCFQPTPKLSKTKTNYKHDMRCTEPCRSVSLKSESIRTYARTRNIICIGHVKTCHVCNSPISNSRIPTPVFPFPSIIPSMTNFFNFDDLTWDEVANLPRDVPLVL